MLAEHEMEKVDLRKRLGISPNTLTKLNKNEEVALSVLIRICDYFKCNIGDICDVVKDESCENKELS